VNGQKSASREPLQLLAQQWRVGAAITVQEEYGREHIEGRIVGRAGLIQTMLQQAGRFPVVDSHDPEDEQHCAGCVDHWNEPATANALEPFFGEAQGEMQQERRLQRLRQRIQPENSPVQQIQLASELKGVPGKRNQAEEIEVGGARSGPAPQEHIQSHGQIDEADETQRLLQTSVGRFGDDQDRLVQRNAVAGNGVIGLDVNACAIQFAVQV